MTASSNHPGGVNVVFVDASARFVTDSIDAGNQSWAPPGWNNVGDGGHGGRLPAGLTTSQYGLWGALGTRAGGESRSL